ncbi:MAG: hypothetical protein GKS00_13935 [Alphaproteobacteria bacterium]|nr:hypothetical protein [Alphaproteobacteria bacterium]
MAQAALRLPKETRPTELEDQEQMEADMDSLHILPLNIIPLKTPSLRRAKLIKNVRLESVIELFNDTGGGSGQIETEVLADMFDWPKNGKHPDERIISALTELHSFDVYSLRIQLRKLGIRVEQFNQRLRLSEKKRAELMQYMNVFTLPLLQQVYNTTDSTVDNMEELVKKFTAPDRQEALKNLKLIADKLHIRVQEVPNFLEEYADIYLSISYGKDTLNSLIPKILSFEEAMEELKENYELRNDVRLMRSIDYIKDSITDVTASVVSRFESFDRSSETMWDDISAESFNQVKKLTRKHHISIGAILCGLSVKMNGWEHSLSKGRGLVRRADFVRSDMMQGMEKISQIEEILKRQQAVPTWESFTIETGRK